MSIFDFLRRKKELKEPETFEHPVYSRIPEDNEIEGILNAEIEEFFPTNGRWGRSCYKKSTELSAENLPCHLRDNNWLAQYLEIRLFKKGLIVPNKVIYDFIVNSDRFNELRRNYELEIVRWQIDWMRNGGEGWLMPKGYDELSLMFSPEAVEIFRGGVVRTLTEIGMDTEVIEEGIESNADMFRERFISTGFSNEFEPVLYGQVAPAPADKEHRENWLKLQRYEYYCRHKRSVDRYGEPHPDMLITPREVRRLYEVLSVQNKSRRQEISQWKENELSGFYDKLNKKTSDLYRDDQGK